MTILKLYLVFVGGDEVGMVRAGSHNAAEKKAQAKYGAEAAKKGLIVTVAYTEV